MGGPYNGLPFLFKARFADAKIFCDHLAADSPVPVFFVLHTNGKQHLRNSTSVSFDSKNDGASLIYPQKRPFGRWNWMELRSGIVE